jgi:catechol 2,3-dioxygenase-like lactoylglutathione lyase family enzyme
MTLVTPLKRTAIIVKDLRRSLRFWRDALGMNVWIDGKAGRELPALFKLLGAPPCTTRWVILQSEDVDWGMVGLFELSRPAPPSVPDFDRMRAHVGEACLVFHTADVEAIYRAAKRQRLPILCPPTRLELKDHGVESIEMTLRDPNGVLVNLIQNVKGGRVGISNQFPGLKRLRSGASSRRQSE